MIDKIEQHAASLNEQRDKWVEDNVLPHMQALLDQAQSKISDGIRFLSGNGTYGFYFDKHGERDWNFTNAVSQPESYLKGENPIVHRYRARFPELVEFVDIVVVLGDELDYVPDDMTPTNYKKAEAA